MFGVETGRLRDLLCLRASDSPDCAESSSLVRFERECHIFSSSGRVVFPLYSSAKKDK